MPGIKRITHLSQSGIRPLNEDKVLVNKPQKLFGVFDGASSLVSYLSPDKKTGAYIAAKVVAGTFANTDKDLKATALAANDNIEKAHLEAGIDTAQNVNRFSTTAAVAKLSKDKAELLQIGDSVILIINKDGRVEVPLSYHDHDIEVMRKWRKLADQGRSGIRAIIANDVIELRETANSSYGMLNGDKKVGNFIKTAVISLDNVASILILTDGMYMPKADPDAEEDWNYHAKLYQKGGLTEIYNAVRKKEESDPDLIKYPRYKLHDDASAVAIDLA